jgi:thiol-disulfide isomerase/thioredoxin
MSIPPFSARFVDSFTPVAGKIAIAVLAAGVLAVAGLAIFGHSADKTPSYDTVAAVAPDLTNADPRLKAIYAQASKLLPGGVTAYDARVASLHGLPIVVNKWGSWCDPCRREFPSFQKAAKQLGGRVAFLGANVQDSTDAANAFLKTYPVPYPSYIDDKLQIAAALKPAGFAPVTGFYSVGGKLVHVHAGPYDTAAALKADIKKYTHVNLAG